jgi:hypothetical protein
MEDAEQRRRDRQIIKSFSILSNSVRKLDKELKAELMALLTTIQDDSLAISWLYALFSRSGSCAAIYMSEIGFKG